MEYLHTDIKNIILVATVLTSLLFYLLSLKSKKLGMLGFKLSIIAGLIILYAINFFELLSFDNFAINIVLFVLKIVWFFITPIFSMSHYLNVIVIYILVLYLANHFIKRTFDFNKQKNIILYIILLILFFFVDKYSILSYVEQYHRFRGNDYFFLVPVAVFNILKSYIDFYLVIKFTLYDLFDYDVTGSKSKRRQYTSLILSVYLIIMILYIIFILFYTRNIPINYLN